MALKIYSPVNYAQCNVDYSNVDQISESFDIWGGDLGLDPKNYSSISDGYNDCIDKLIYISAYIEAKGYPVGTDISFLNGIFTYITFTNGLKNVIKYGTDDFLEIYTYTLTYSTFPAFSFSLLTKFDQNLWVNKGIDYDNIVRGNSFMLERFDALNETNVGTFLIGSSYNSIAVISMLHKINSMNISGVIINPPSVFLNGNPLTAFYKKLTIYYNMDWKFKMPTDLEFINNNTTTVKNLNEFNLAKTDPLYIVSYIKFNYTPMCIQEYNSVYSLVINTINGNIVNSCDLSLGIQVPTRITIPTVIADKFKARKTYYGAKYDVENTIITNYKAKYYNPTSGLVGFTTTDDKLFVALVNEIIVTSVTDQSTTIDVTYNGNNYKLLSEVDKDFTTDITNMMTALNITNAFIGNFFIYSFGQDIHSFLRDFDNSFNDLDYTKGCLYIEGLPSLTKGFTSFSGFTPSNVEISNIWQDNIINSYTLYDGLLDNIQVTKLYDILLHDNIEENSPCIHSIYAYDLLITE